MNQKMIAWTLWFLIFLATLFYLPDLFSFLDKGITPDHSPPWYFIYGDLREGLASTMGFIFSLFLIYGLRGLDDKTIRLLVFFTVIWYSHSLGNTISILMNTNNVFDPANATTSWETHRDYLNSPWNRYLFYAFICLILIVFLRIDNNKAKKINE